MPDEIQKYNHANGQPEKKAKKDIFKFIKFRLIFERRYKFILLLIKIIGTGLLLFAANGLLPKVITIILTFLAIVFFCYTEFFKHRNEITKPQYWIGVILVLFFFGTLSYFLFTHNNVISDELSHEKNRAHIEFLEMSVLRFKPKQEMQFGMVIRNWGETRALKVNWFLEPIFELYTPRWWKTGNPVGGGLAYEPIILEARGTPHQAVITGETLSQELYDSVMSRKLNIFLIGQVTYTDIYDTTRCIEILARYDWDVNRFATLGIKDNPCFNDRKKQDEKKQTH